MITGGAAMRDRTTQCVCEVPFREKTGYPAGLFHDLSIADKLSVAKSLE
jgi:hypothetical protein